MLSSLFSVFALVTSSASAHGLEGMPTRCDGSIWISQAATLSCKTADGTSFLWVPAGKVFLVTDVQISDTDYVIGDANSQWNVSLDETDSNSTLLERVAFSGTFNQTTVANYTSPMIFVDADNRLLATMADTTNNTTLDIDVAGILYDL